MRTIIKDLTNTTIYEGSDAKDVFRVLTAEPCDISEQDEVMYEQILRTTEFTGKLRLVEYDDDNNLIVNIKFRGIDDWNRPVFKDITRSIYFGDVNKLWVYDELGEDNSLVNAYYKEHTEALEYFGDSFNCEPHGGLPPNIKLNVII